MFGWWRRKSDGFEWHKYVRTTIKLRRNERKKRIDEIKHAAARKVQDAGVAGAEAGRAGLAAAGHGLNVGLRAAGHGLNAGAVAGGRGALAGLAVFWRMLRELPGIMGRAAAWLAHRVWPYLLEAWLILLDILAGALFVLGRGLTTIRRALQQPSIAPMLAGAAITVAFYALFRLVWFGADRAALVALAIAATLATIAILAVREPLGLPGASVVTTLGRVAWWPFGWLIDRAADGMRRSNLSLRATGISATAIAAIALIGFGGYALWTNAPHVNPMGALNLVTGSATQTLRGRARPILGDTLSIAGRRIRLSSIEAPELSQVCRTHRGRAWRCGIAARRRLTRLVRRGTTTCKVTKSDAPRLFVGTCTVRGRDVAEYQVRNGYAFATGGLIASTYSDEEQAARKLGAGIWRGEVARPADFRANRWARAKRTAPDGCPIKGRIVRGSKVYVLPWTPRYRRVRVRARRGERWFCSEKDAIAAGWHPAPTG
jgi:endonuclease YncB( thermonuclease family)